MPDQIKYTPVFEKYFKRYSKKYRTLKDDLKSLEKQLLENPKLGIDLGEGLFKIRLGVKSKNKGKSGGIRVITYLLTKKTKGFDINLIIIYDKSEIDDIPKKELIRIIKKIFNKPGLIK